MKLNNQTMANHPFLKDMYTDTYFPDDLVKKGENILVELCWQIEQEKPASLEELYKLTHAATDRFNLLQEEFWDRDSEIETVARDTIGMDFHAIALAYGFADADIEELISPRDW